MILDFAIVLDACFVLVIRCDLTMKNNLGTRNIDGVKILIFSPYSDFSRVVREVIVLNLRSNCQQNVFFFFFHTFTNDNIDSVNTSLLNEINFLVAE